MIDRKQIEPLHAEYVRLTGLNVPLSFGRNYLWECWLLKKFTMKDLQDVVGYIQRAIKKQERREASLRFDNLIRDVERFQEDLASVNKLRSLRDKAARPLPRPSRADAVQTAGAHTEVKVGEVLSKVKLDEYMTALRKAANESQT